MRQNRGLAMFAVSAAAILAAAVVPGASASAANGAAATFSISSDWGTGYEAKYTITNGSNTALTWRVEFDLPSGATISSFWDANLAKTGNHVVATGTWNASLPAGGTASFGWIGAPGGITPSNCTLNGLSCLANGGDGGNPGAPGAPGNFRVTGTTSSSIALAWDAPGGTVTGYRVYEGSTVRATVSGTSTTITGLGGCTSHTYVVRAYNSVGESASSGSAGATTSGCTSSGAMAAAPYLYEGWGSPPAPSTVMSATGVKWFTMAFVLSSGGCTPAWDGARPLTGGADAQAISQIRAAGGDVIPSFGGWSGNKLGPNCATAQDLANAYQQVITAFNLKAIDIDIENTDEFESEAVQDRILGALKIVKQNNPGIKTIVTFGTSTTGPTWWGTRLIDRSAALAANVDVFTIMPFDFGGGANMYQNTVNAAEGLKNALKTAYGWNDDTAYRHMGISGMNGLSDQQELTSTATWTQIRDWAAARHLARLAFWSVNRDRPCAGGGVQSACSGIDQPNWEFTRITAAYSG